MADISEIVNVNLKLEDTGLLRREFGKTLMLTSLFPTNGNFVIPFLSEYASLSEVEARFGNTTQILNNGDQIYKAAEIYFSQQPYPKNLMIGIVDIAQDLRANLQSLAPVLADIQAITNGSLDIDGEIITGLDFSSATSISDVASILDTALTAVSGYTLNSVKFDLVQNSAVNETILVQNSEAPPSKDLVYFKDVVGDTFNTATTLKLTEETALGIRQYIAKRNVGDWLSYYESLDPSFYFVTFGPSTPALPANILIDSQNVIDAAQWVQARPYMFFIESYQTQALVTDDTTSIFGELFGDGNTYDRVSGDWTPENATNPALETKYLSLSSAARLSGVDFNQTNGIINPKFKARPGIEPSVLNTSQVEELNRKRVNRYTAVGGGATSPTIQDIYVEGTTFKNGVWQDIRYSLDWLINAIQVDVFDLLLNTPRLPQTDEGSNLVITTINNVLSQARRNGILAPGTLSPSLTQQIQDVTGNRDFNGFLPNAYLVFADPYVLQPESDRIQRESTQFYIWAKGSGAVNRINISGVLEQ